MLITCFSQIAERDYFYENLIWRIKSVKQQPNLKIYETNWIFYRKSWVISRRTSTIKLASFEFGEAANDIASIEPNFTSQTNELNDIRFQMNLMFLEFDNGKLFNKKLNDFNKTLFDNTPFLKHLVNINELFIDYLNEYRVE